MRWITPLRELTMKDVALVGGKNASLGEMLRELTPLGVSVPDGFAITADAYRDFLRHAHLEQAIKDLLAGVDRQDTGDLAERSQRIRNLILAAPLPPDLTAELARAYRDLGEHAERDVHVAVRSSATAEDLPGASFAGQQESYLHVHGDAELAESVRRCYASLFSSRAIAYRIDMGFAHEEVALSVGVQRMVCSDRGAAGVIFTLDTESGSRDVVLISSAYGLGESVVQGRVSPDELVVHKATLAAGYRPLVWKKVGTKESKIIWNPASGRVVTVPTTVEERSRLSLGEDDALTLARWAMAIEQHYSRLRGEPTPMDIEWAKDGESGQLFVVQARPETVHSRRTGTRLKLYGLTGTGEVLARGVAIGDAIAQGPTRVVRDAKDIGQFTPGDVLVTDTTDPDWEPIMKAAKAIVTERGGRTSHAAIVAREIGIPAIVGVPGAMTAIPGGQLVTVSCAEGEIGTIYRGEVPYRVEDVDPGDLPSTRTKIYMNLAQPERAFQMAQLPCDGVGLARMEFIFAGWVGVHPLALTRYASLPDELRRQVDHATRSHSDKIEFFVDRLAQGIGTLAAAFHPRPVILRFSDFKSNEYARLIGGAPFEPVEENPMLGWRGASRYYHPEYREGFLLECAAVRRVRETFGLDNLKLMVPFCRTPEEGARVLETAAQAGLVRGQRGLEWYVMAEIPSNVLLAERFAELFDGFSIGSNDLTQLILGVDRDSARVAPLFDERNEAVKRACAMLIESAHRAGRTVGICGQAPSDYPEFAAYLVDRGIDSLSLAPDVLIATRRQVAGLERRRPSAVA